MCYRHEILSNTSRQLLLKTLRLIKEVRIVKKKSKDFFKYSLHNLRAP